MKTLAVVAVVLVLVLAVFATRKARKLDAMHKNVVKSRVALERALFDRSRRSVELSRLGVLDVASAVLLADVAGEAMDAASAPLVDDGLQSIVITDDAGEPIAQQYTAPRVLIESELSKVLRMTVDGLDCSEIDEEAKTAIDALNKSRETVRLTRRFHNNHVALARRARSTFGARALRLYGKTTQPLTVDLDDE